MRPGPPAILAIAPLWLGVALATPATAPAQERGADTASVLLLDHLFDADSAAPVVVTLERRTVYRVVVNGPGTPVFQPVGRRGQTAFVGRVGGRAGDDRRVFELQVRVSGPHEVTIADRPSGSRALVRVYRNVAETRRLAVHRARQMRVGGAVAAGGHTGYRLDPSNGASPRGGTDAEACLLVETGTRFGTCLGALWQSFPSGGFTATWIFLEQRIGLVSTEVLGRSTALGAALRVSQSLESGPRHVSGRMLGIGLFVAHRLSAGTRGLTVTAAWQHGRLGDAPETEFLDTDRFTAGLSWIP